MELIVVVTRKIGSSVGFHRVKGWKQRLIKKDGAASEKKQHG